MPEAEKKPENVVDMPKQNVSEAGKALVNEVIQPILNDIDNTVALTAPQRLAITRIFQQHAQHHMKEGGRGG